MLILSQTPLACAPATDFSVSAVTATEISCWQNSGSHPRGPGAACMSKHCKPHSWSLQQLAQSWIQPEAGIVISRRCGMRKTRGTTVYSKLYSKPKNVLRTQGNKLWIGLSQVTELTIYTHSLLANRLQTIFKAVTVTLHYTFSK